MPVAKLGKHTLLYTEILKRILKKLWLPNIIPRDLAEAHKDQIKKDNMWKVIEYSLF